MEATTDFEKTKRFFTEIGLEFVAEEDGNDIDNEFAYIAILDCKGDNDVLCDLYFDGVTGKYENCD